MYTNVPVISLLLLLLLVLEGTVLILYDQLLVLITPKTI